MGRHGFGRGEYQYFKYRLPPIIDDPRTALYARLAPVANSWNEAMGIGVRYPANHGEFLERCHAAGQQRPTPLLLQYAAGDPDVRTYRPARADADARVSRERSDPHSPRTAD
jgi:hypothetical protein